MKTHQNVRGKSTDATSSLRKASVAAGLALLATAAAQASTDYGPAIWRPLCEHNWYDSGNGHRLCVVHDMEGYYSSIVSSFPGCGYTRASVYYAINGIKDAASDYPAGEISQLGVRESQYAWHACCWNTWMFGCEHEGFVSNPAWYTDAMYNTSIPLYKHWCEAYGIPKDRNHVIAHGQKLVAGWSAWSSANYPYDPNCNTHTDPGSYWDWTRFMNGINATPPPPTVPQAGCYTQPVTCNKDGRMELCAVGTDSNVYKIWENSPSGLAWSGWLNMGGAGTSPGSVMAMNADGRLQFFVRGSGNSIWFQYQNTPGGSWSGWGTLGGGALTTPVVGVDANGALEVIVVGTDTAVWHNYQLGPNGSWSGWSSLAGPGTQQVTVGRNADGRLEIFTWGGNGAIWHNYQVSPVGSWAGWGTLGGSMIGKPAVGMNANGALELWAVGTDHQFWHNFQVGPNGAWSGWGAMGGAGQTDPNITIAQNADGRLEVYAIGSDTAVWHNYQLTPVGSWAGWGSFGGPGSLPGIAVGRNLDGRLQFFVRGSGNSIWYQYQNTAGGGWSGWGSLGGSLAGLFF